jgi:uncharacterized membrane protein
VTRSPRALGAFFTFAGIMHFVRPGAYRAIVPDYSPVPAHEAVVWSGVAEIAGGLAAIPASTRRLSRWWLLGLLLAVFPANVHMAVRPDEVAKRGVPADRIPKPLLWGRLPVQALFAAWVWRATE